MECLQSYVEGGYVIIFNHDKNVTLPPFCVVRKMLFSFSRKMRKGLRRLIIQTPTNACKERLSYLENLVSEKAAKRLERTDEWREHVPHESSTLIRAVLRGDDVGFDQDMPGAEKRGKFEAEGLLYKKSSKNLLGTSSWKKRWVRIDKEALYIYSTSHRPDVGTEPKSVLILEGSVVESEVGKRQQFGLCITLANPVGAQVHLAGQTEEETEVWLKRMRAAARYAKVFGVPLEIHLRETGRHKALPAIAEQCIALLRAHALELEGVLRVAGSQKRLQEYKLAYDLVGDAAIENEKDMHTIADLLKTYLRELPLPLIPHEVYPDVLAVVTDGDGAPWREGEALPAERVEQLAAAVAGLPDSNKRLLRELLLLAAEIVLKSAHNKMSSFNIATVLAPNMLRAPEDPPHTCKVQQQQLLQDSLAVNSAVHAMLVHLGDLADALDTPEGAPLERVSHASSASDTPGLLAPDSLQVYSLPRAARAWGRPRACVHVCACNVL